MRMYNPPHPGEILRDLYLEALGLTVTAAADALGVSRVTLSRLVNEKAGISAEMALRLARAFDTTPDFWLGMQLEQDLWQARKTNLKKVRKLHAAA